MTGQRALLGWMLAALIILSVGQLLSLTERSGRNTAEVIPYTGQSLSVPGIVIREEIPVTADPGGDWVPAVRDGQRASAGQILLYERSGPEEARRTRTRICRAAADAADLPVPSRREAIREAIARCSGSAGEARMEAAETLTGLLLAEGGVLLPERQDTAPALRTVTSPGSGVFSTAADGLESLLTPEDPWYVWPLPPAPPARGTAGRLVTGDTWYFRTRLPFSVSPQEELTGLLPWYGEPLSLRVEEVRGGTALMSCGQGLSEVAAVRQIEMKITENSEKGLEIPADGVYTVEGKNGVWRREGEAARFVPVTVLRRTGKTAVVRADPADPLAPGDEILLDGQ